MMYKQIAKQRHPLMDAWMPFGLNAFQDAFNSEKEAWTPRTDISENAEGYDLHIALPGIKKEDILVKMENQILQVKAERKQVKEEHRTYHRMETRYGMFERSFRLGEKADHERIEAKFEDGILHLHIPKREKENQKTAVIEIK